MSTKHLWGIINRFDEVCEEDKVVTSKAIDELKAIEKAAKGLNQLNPRKDWNQQEWDDGLDLMETIAKEAP